MIRLHYPNEETLAEEHYVAVRDYVTSKSDDKIDDIYQYIRNLFPSLDVTRDRKDFRWLRNFILADVATLENWAVNQKKNLNFDFFKKLYLNRFAKDSTTFVDREGTYNAYSFLNKMDFHVCPYCDEEFIDTVKTSEGDRRTADIDHFLPKIHLPGLAMCFYNLVPSGKGCNQIMNKTEIDANPYDPSIEDKSKFFQDTPIGKIVDCMTDNEIKIRLHTEGKMIRNNAVLGLEERYNNRKCELRQLFKLKSLLTPENLASLNKTGFEVECIRAAVGQPYPSGRGQDIHRKLRHDLLNVRGLIADGLP